MVAPKLASFTSKTDTFKYLKKLQLFVLGIGIVGIIIGIPLSYYVIPSFYGGDYVSSINSFIILLFAQAIFFNFYSGPYSNNLLFSYPKLFVYITLVNFLILLVGVGSRSAHLAILVPPGYF